ncbi:hypothetical protein KR084_007086, partial [Drosophila pseudotakahashii]
IMQNYSSCQLEVGYEPNGLKLWNINNEKFIVARDVIVDETNMINSRAVKSGVEFLNESKEVASTNILNESKEIDNRNILNESKEIDNTNILNESKEIDITNILNESKDCDKMNIQNDSMEKTFDTKDPNDSNECSSRRSNRLKNRPQISCKENE